MAPFLLTFFLSLLLSSVISALPSTALDNRLHRRGASGSNALSLPIDEVIDEDLVTLPVATGKRSSGDVVSGRQLPVDEEDFGAVVTLPVIHSTKRGLISRQLDLDLAKRSDVAYYAQSKPQWLPVG
jgi:hypothetical protein